MHLAVPCTRLEEQVSKKAVRPAGKGPTRPAIPLRGYANTPEPLIVDLHEQPLKNPPDPRPPRRRRKAYAEWMARKRDFSTQQIRARERRLEEEALDVILWENFLLTPLRHHADLIPHLRVLKTFLPGFSHWYLTHGPTGSLNDKMTDEQREALNELQDAGVNAAEFLGVLSQTSHSIEALWVKWVVEHAVDRGIVPPARGSKWEARSLGKAPKRARETVRARALKLAALPIHRRLRQGLEYELDAPAGVKALLRAYPGYANRSHNPAVRQAIPEAFKFLGDRRVSAKRAYKIIGAFLRLPPDAVRERLARHVSRDSGGG